MLNFKAGGILIERIKKEKRTLKETFSVVKPVWLAVKRERIPQLFLLIIIVILIGTTGFYLFEKNYGLINSHDFTKKILDSLWWTFVTVCTVGYGDITPKTFGGRAIGVFLMFSGITLLSLVTAIIASILVERKIREEKGLESIRSSGHIVIGGWNENGFEILEGIKLSDSPHKEVVLITELGEEAINDLKFKYKDDLDIKYIKGDFSSEAALQRANIFDANAVILLSDAGGGQNPEKADARIILAALTVKSLAPNVRLSAELLKKENEAHLKRARADEIVVRGEHSGYFLATSSLAPGVPEVIKELLSFKEGNDLKRTDIPPLFVGKTFKELLNYFRDKQKSILIGLISESKGIGLDDILSNDFSAIDEFIKQKFQEAGEDLLETGTKGVFVNLNPDDSYIIKEGELAVVISPRGK